MFGVWGVGVGLWGVGVRGVESGVWGSESTLSSWVRFDAFLCLSSLFLSCIFE